MKNRFKLVLIIAALLAWGLPEATIHANSQSEAGEKIFTYMLNMADVDSASDARAYHYEARPSALIGFTGRLTASKRLPYKIGPGRVRVYLSTFPEGDEKKLAVTLGGQTKSVTYSKATPRYSWHELVFDLDKPYDMLTFEAGSLDGEKARVIWYSTMLTNDPALQYVQVAKDKFKILRQGERYANPPGNLVPNSSFEEGIQHWDISPYKSNIMVKPSLLQTRAAHYQLAMDVGQIPVTSRWFPLETGREYNLSYHVSSDNALPVEAILQSKMMGSKEKVVLKLHSAEAVETAITGWKRVSAVFSVQGEAEVGSEQADNDTGLSTNQADFRLVFSADVRAGSKALVDSVQITQGRALLPYELHGGLEFNVISPSTQGIHLVDAPSDMYMNLASEPEVAIQEVTYTVTDYYDRVVAGPKALQIARPGQLPVELATDRAGLFRVRTWVTYTTPDQSQPRSLEREFFYNVVHPSSPRKDRLTWSLLGGYFTSAPQGEYSYAEVANHFGIYEFNTLGHQMGRWKANMARDPMDRSKYLRKQYDFSSSEKQLQRFADNNMNTIVNFHVNSTSGSYGVPHGLNPEAGPAFEFDNGVRFSQEDWLHFVSAYVTHFKGRIKRYEVQDEPYQYFTPDNYASFYLATWKAIKEADPDAMVFMHNAQGKMEYIDSLDALTGGKAHEHMDGVYLYLTQQHSGRISRDAVPAFRAWARKYNLPIHTATCFSPGQDFDTHPLGRSPDYLPQREAEHRSIQHFFDGLIWGQSQAFYYYYGSHPSGGYASLFDSHGQIIPMIHFYAAANALVGDHTQVTSIDVHDALRIGVVETQRNKNYAILYSVDGKLHNVTVDAGVLVQMYDGFGNPLPDPQTNDGSITLIVGPQPVYMQVHDAKQALVALEAATLRDTLDVRLTYESRAEGGLGLRAFVATDQPLKGWTDTQGVYRREVITPAHTREIVKGLHELKIPLAVSPVNSLNSHHMLAMSTNLGEHYAAYPHSYMPLLAGTPDIAGGYSASQWPGHEAQTVPLAGYYLPSGKDRRAEYNRGQVALMRDGQSLYGLATIFKPSSQYTLTLQIAPRDHTGLVNEEQAMHIVIGEETITVNGREISEMKLARSSLDDPELARQLKATDVMMFSIPLAALPQLRISEGLTYGLRIVASDPPLADTARTSSPTWYLDARWPGPEDVNADQATPRWGTLMVVD